MAGGRPSATLGGPGRANTGHGRLVRATGPGVPEGVFNGRQASARAALKSPLRQPRYQETPTARLTVQSPAQLARRPAPSKRATPLSDHDDWRDRQVNPASRPAVSHPPPSRRRPLGPPPDRTVPPTSGPAPCEHPRIRSARRSVHDHRPNTPQPPRTRVFTTACVTGPLCFA